MELESAEVAQRRGQHESVRNLGETIVKDQLAIRNQLKNVAQRDGIQPDVAMEKPHRKEWNRIQETSDSEFDRVYLNHVIRDHERDLSMLEERRSSLEQDGDLANLIDRHLATLRKHLGMARTALVDLQSGSGLNGKFRATRSGYAAVQDDDRDEQASGTDSDQDHGEVLSLPTSNQDGTILGIVPAPSRTVKAGFRKGYIAQELVDGKIDPDIQNVYDADQKAVGVPPISERDQRASKFVGEGTLPTVVRSALRERGWDGSGSKLKRVRVYEVTLNGKTVLATEAGKLFEPANDK